MKFLTQLLSHFSGRKYSAYALTSLLILTAGLTVKADKLSAVTLALLGALTSFVTSHTVSQIKSKTEAKS